MYYMMSFKPLLEWNSHHFQNFRRNLNVDGQI